MKYLLTLALLLLATPALGADAWDDEPGTANVLYPCNFPQQRVCYWDNLESGGLDVTTVIDAGVCENVTASCFSSLTTANHNNTCTIYSNGNGFTISATNLTAEIVQNAVLTGDPATDLFAIYGFDANYIYARFGMVDAGTTTRLALHCHPRVD